MPFFLKESDWTYFTWLLSEVYPKYLALTEIPSKLQILSQGATSEKVQWKPTKFLQDQLHPQMQEGYAQAMATHQCGPVLLWCSRHWQNHWLPAVLFSVWDGAVGISLQQSQTGWERGGWVCCTGSSPCLTLKRIQEGGEPTGIYCHYLLAGTSACIHHFLCLLFHSLLANLNGPDWGFGFLGVKPVFILKLRSLPDY